MSSGTTDSTVTTVVKPPTLKTDIYVTGFVSDDTIGVPHAQLWKNGVGIALSNIISTGLGIIILNGDTYVCGNEGIILPHAVYWKNFLYSTPLTDGNDRTSSANDIALQGSDILCVGYVNEQGGQKAVLWRNRQRTVLANNASASHILVNGADIYVTGFYVDANGQNVACYWKNGIVHNLGTAANQATATGIVIDGNADIYVCGSLNYAPVYWKNDVMTSLPKTRKWAWANAICIKGSDIYIVGSGEDDTFWGYDEAYCWINGVAQSFTGGSSANDIVFVNGKKFISGTQYAARRPYARLWEDARPAYLVPTFASSYTGIYINQHY